MGEQTASSTVKLSRSDLMIGDPKDDVRGRQVVTVDGEHIGEVDDLLIDAKLGHVRFLEVGTGGFLGFGGHKSLVPIDAVTSVDERSVRIDHTHEHVTGAPIYDPEVEQADPYLNSIYGYYGYAPPFVPGAETL